MTENPITTEPQQPVPHAPQAPAPRPRTRARRNGKRAPAPAIQIVEQRAQRNQNRWVNRLLAKPSRFRWTLVFAAILFIAFVAAATLGIAYAVAQPSLRRWTVILGGLIGLLLVIRVAWWTWSATRRTTHRMAQSWHNASTWLTRFLSIPVPLLWTAITGGALLVVLISGAIVQAVNARAGRLVTTHVKRAPLTVKVTESGQLRAENQITISAANDKQILWLIPEGSAVRDGDTLLVFESEKYVISSGEARSSLQVENANLIKAQNELEAQQAREESARQHAESLKSLAGKMFVTGGEVEQARLEYIELQSRTRSLKAAVDAQRANVGRARAAMQQEERKLRQGVILAPRAGLVVYATSGSGEEQKKIATGMTPFAGMDLMYLPDLSSMLVDVEINEVDLARVHPGLRATLTLDAYPGVRFHGEVRSVANLAHRKVSPSTGRPTGARVFDVTVKVMDTDPRLKPGLTASVDIIASEHDSEIVVPLEAVFVNDQDESVVYVRRHGLIESRPVVLGESNDRVVIVQRNLEEGEEVLLGRPAALERYAK